MASTYTGTKNSLEKQATGENENTWGTLANAVFDQIARGIAGRSAKSVAGGSDVTLVAAEYECLIQEYSGALTADINVIVPTGTGAYVVYNNTSGAYTLTVKTSGGTGIAVPQGGRAILYCDGTNVVDVLVSYLALAGGTLTGALLLAVGSASAPGLAFSGDANTGLYRIGADNLGFATNGTLRAGIADAVMTLAVALALADNELRRPKIKDYGLVHSTPSIAAGAITFDCENGNSFAVTLSENITAITLSNPPASGVYGEIVIQITQNASAAKTVAGWPAAVKWADGTAYAASTALSAVDKIVLSTIDGGTTWRGDYSKGYA